MVKPSSPVDGDIALAAVQSSGTFHTPASGDPTELEEAVKDRAVVSDVVFALFFGVLLHIVWGDFREEVYIFVCVELAHLLLRGGLRSLWREGVSGGNEIESDSGLT